MTRQNSKTFSNTYNYYTLPLSDFSPSPAIFPIPNDTSTPRRPSASPSRCSNGVPTFLRAWNDDAGGVRQLGQRWRHNCAMFNSKLQETIKRATPVGVMGAECRRNVATPRGNHSLSRRAGAQLVVGCSRSAWAALDNTPCTVFGSRGRWEGEDGVIRRLRCFFGSSSRDLQSHTLTRSVRRFVDEPIVFFPCDRT